MYLTIEGNVTADRNAWMNGAGIHQQLHYVDPDETIEVITNRYSWWRSKAICDRVEGFRIRVPKVFEILQGLAGMHKGKAVTHGAPPIEYFQFMSFSMKVSIARWFIKYFTDLSMPKPTDWNAVQLVGIQGENTMGGLDKLRWVGKTAAAQTWFLKMESSTL